MTCVSERSGSASSGMFLIVQKERPRTTRTAAVTRYRFSAEKRMTRLIMGLLASHGRERGAQARLRVDEEVGARDHLLAGAQPGDGLDELGVGGADPHLARL